MSKQEEKVDHTLGFLDNHNLIMASQYIKVIPDPVGLECMSIKEILMWMDVQVETVPL